MKTNIRIFLLCSVPEDQKPIQEYLSFQENSFSKWITLPKKEYQKKLFVLMGSNFLIVAFVRFLFSPLKPLTQEFGQIFSDPFSFFPQIFGQELSEYFFQNCFWGVFLTFLLLLGILFRCQEIQNHFFESRLSYEEASWYDGQIWEKPFVLLKNDRLLSTQKLEPILKRIFRTLSSFLMAILLLLLISF